MNLALNVQPSLYQLASVYKVFPFILRIQDKGFEFVTHLANTLGINSARGSDISSTYDEYSDHQLIALLNNNDDKAFEVLYRKYVNELYSYARRNISTKEDCEEIIQDIFTDIWRRRNSLQQIGSIKAYLFTSVRYKIIRYIQHSKLKMKYANHYLIFETIYELPENVELNSPKSITSKLLEGISELPNRCQEAFRLRVLENLSNDEIAKRMSISKKTVEVYMVKAFNHLRTMPELIGI